MFQTNVAFKDFPHSDFVEDAVRKRAEKLGNFFDRIVACDITVSEPHRSHHQGNLFNLKIHLKLPGGKDLVISRDPGKDGSHEDVYVVIRDAFNSLERQLKSHIGKMRNEIKHHSAPPVGVVAKIFNDDGYGFIITPDGREVYFHENSVIEGFEKLKKGSQVRFSEEAGEKGPQASSVHVVGKNGRKADDLLKAFKRG
jgi:cold shock CspA family protein